MTVVRWNRRKLPKTDFVYITCALEYLDITGKFVLTKSIFHPNTLWLGREILGWAWASSTLLIYVIAHKPCKTAESVTGCYYRSLMRQQFSLSPVSPHQKYVYVITYADNLQPFRKSDRMCKWNFCRTWFHYQPASSKASLNDDTYERQPGRTARVCTPIVQVVLAPTFRIGS